MIRKKSRNLDRKTHRSRDWDTHWSRDRDTYWEDYHNRMSSMPSFQRDICRLLIPSILHDVPNEDSLAVSRSP